MMTIIVVVLVCLVLIAVARALGGLIIIVAVIWLGVTGADKVHMAFTEHLPGYKEDAISE